ncbi:MAG: type IV pilus secretin PilQ family protein [Pseudomonadales bacterium]|nr:type IV pilus secretin PilQ family protein [Pseudomonadales bacterium]
MTDKNRTSVSTTFRLWFAALVTLLATALSTQQAWAAARLTGMEFSSLPGDRTEIRMAFDGTPPNPQGYTIEEPARIVLDMPGVVSALEEKHHDLGAGNARKVSILSTKDRTRAIVNLTRLVGYDTEVRGNTLYLLVGGEASGAPAPSLSEQQAFEQTAPAGGSSVANVDFRRSAEGGGRIIVSLSNPKAPVSVESDAGKIRIEVRNTALPANLRRRLDVTDFATPVQVVDAIQEGDHTVITVTATGNYDYLAYQADNQLSVEVTPMTEEEVAKREDVFKYSGEKLSLNFQDIEVRSVLQLIADFTDLNLVASDTVSGRITLRLKNVPWDQALELILKTKGLDQRQVGNVLLVAPAAEIAAREKLELENRKQISELAPLRTEFVQVRYASATQLFGLFKGGEEGSTTSILSDRGSVIVDERTNSIIITDTSDRLENFRRIVAQLDIPVRQVMIEARIVTATANFSEELGINWGGAILDRRGSNRAVRVGGSTTTLTELQNAFIGEDTDITTPGDLVVDLGVTQPGTSSIAVGFSKLGNYLIDLELSAFAKDGHAEVVSRPKVIMADKSTAMIESGVEIPYQEATSSGATNVSFKDAVLSLEVTPQITPDDRIIMKLNVKQDTVGTIFNGVPSINTNEVETEVLVPNGETVVLGGIFTTDKNISTTKTPFLGDLPYIGRLFRNTLERDDKQELLIFISPRIIADTLTK